MKKDKLWYKYYDVDENGRVWRRDSGYVIKQMVNHNGYRRVLLSIDGIGYQFRVHRLVAMKYLPNPYCYEQVNHKDGDKGNNSVCNLEWCSGVDNVRHGLITGLIASGQDSPYAKLSNADVDNVRQRLLHGESYKRIWKDYSDRISWWGFRDICRGNSRVKRN